jgi:hypothetical protein
VDNVARIRRKIDAYKVLVKKNLREISYLENLRVGGRIFKK